MLNQHWLGHQQQWFTEEAAWKLILAYKPSQEEEILHIMGQTSPA
jgi:hypothetical protein